MYPITMRPLVMSPFSHDLNKNTRSLVLDGRASKLVENAFFGNHIKLWYV